MLKTTNMRKLLCFMALLIGLLWTAVPAWAQDRTVSGRVTGEDSRALPGVTVNVKGTARFVVTNATGAFTVVARTGDILVFTAVGQKRSEYRLTDANNVELQMNSRDDKMEEIVVTAMDQRRNPRELGFSNQGLKGNEIAETGRENFVNSLQGRIAGLTVNSTGGMAGSSSQIVLRGFNSLSLDNSPLFVIDGIIVDNSTVNETSNGGTALGQARDLTNRQNDYSNRISDINPADIESITVLKGPEATALYGSQASSGAIIITTKKAPATGRVGVTYDNSFRIATLTRFPKSINEFDGGTNGVEQAIFSSFGPRYDPRLVRAHNLYNFFQTGTAQTHNLSVEYGKKNASFRLSGSYFNQEAPIPTNTYKRYTARLSNTTKIGTKLDLSPAITLARTENDKPLRGASGYLLNLLAWPADNDIRNYQDANGLKLPLFSANPNADLDNPFYNVFNNRSSDQTDRLTATLGINFTPFSFLTLSGRFGYDTYRTEGYTRYDSMSFYVTRAQRGLQDNYYRNYYGYNHTITATARKTVGDFAGRLLIGTMWQDYETQMFSVSGNNLKDFSLAAAKDSNNTDPTTRLRLINARRGLPNYSINRQAAYFAEATLGWKNAVFLTYSHRFEESSIFPKEFRKYNYPAGSVSVIVSDLLPFLKSSNALTYWKIRGSVAQTARSSAPYANQSVFAQNIGSGGGFYYGFTNNNPFLRPERQNTFEVGTEFRLFNSRVSFDATYYNTRNSDLIVEQFRASYGTGFVLNTLNVGANQNQGVEISLDGTLVQTKNFRWNSRINITRMWNEVTELPANVPEFYQSDTWLYGNARGGLVVGGPTTSITSFGYQRNNRGDVLIDATTGIPLVDANFRIRGDRNPDLTIGYLNNFSYKNLRLNFLWDVKIGGDIFNATDRYLTTIGRSYRTLDRLTPRVVKGVLNDGLQNSATPTPNNIALTPYFNQTYYTTMPEEEFIEKDVNWFRLRDVSLNYSFGTGFVKRLRYVRGLSAFVTVNDLVLITNYTGADPAVNGTTAGSRGVGAFGFDFGNIGAPISWNFGLKANF